MNPFCRRCERLMLFSREPYCPDCAEDIDIEREESVERMREAYRDDMLGDDPADEEGAVNDAQS